MTIGPASRPRLLVVAGPNGAGKTTITERGLAHEWFQDCEYINPDVIAQEELGDWNDAEIVLRAAKLATERRETCLREQRSVAFETVFSAADKPEFVRRAVNLGYFVRIFFVGTDRPEINAARVARRVLQGGHEVPIRKIVDRWARSIANVASVCAEVDRLYVYDNSVDDRDAQLVLRAAEGRVVKAYGDVPAWAGPILERLTPRES